MLASRGHPLSELLIKDYFLPSSLERHVHLLVTTPLLASRNNKGRKAIRKSRWIKLAVFVCNIKLKKHSKYVNMKYGHRS